jgi:hypothetical protein
MTEKRNITERPNPGIRQNRYIRLTARLLFYAGVLIILSGLVYMLINLSKSDSLFHLWLPYIVTGIAMVCIGLLISDPLAIPHKRHSMNHDKNPLA